MAPGARGLDSASRKSRGPGEPVHSEVGVGPANRVAVGILVLSLGAIGFAAGRILMRPSGEVIQPISFNHKVHTEALECETCHELVTSSEHSGLPGLSLCMQCHEEPLTESPEEEKLRELAAAGEEQVFRKLFTLPDNVYYSHRMHVGIAEVECVSCHGDIASSEAPPEGPLVRVTMDFCLECHETHGVSADCTRCHR